MLKTTADKVSTDITNTPNLCEVLSSVFEWMPTCSVIIDKDLNILEINHEALLFFKCQNKNTFQQFCTTSSIFIDKLIISEIIKKNSDTKAKRKTFLSRTDKTIACIDIEVSPLPNNSNYFLIQFSDNSHETHSIFEDIVQSFKNDIEHLKPYLNKPGKEVLNQIMKNDKLDAIIKNTPLHNQQIELIRHERIKQLSVLFPNLSQGELLLCAYLSLKISIVDIAKFTGKTDNSLRVAFHRIVKKTVSLSGKDLLKQLYNLK